MHLVNSNNQQQEEAYSAQSQPWVGYSGLNLMQEPLLPVADYSEEVHQHSHLLGYSEVAQLPVRNPPGYSELNHWDLSHLQGPLSLVVV